MVSSLFHLVWLNVSKFREVGKPGRDAEDSRGLKTGKLGHHVAVTMKGAFDHAILGSKLTLLESLMDHTQVRANRKVSMYVRPTCELSRRAAKHRAQHAAFDIPSRTRVRPPCTIPSGGCAQTAPYLPVYCLGGSQHQWMRSRPLHHFIGAIQYITLQ